MMMRTDVKPYSAKFIQMRKLLVVLPVLVLPFLIFLLWQFHFIKSVDGAAVQNDSAKFNMTFPSAIPSKDSTWDKMRFYEKADRDSQRLLSLLKNDPYRSLEPLSFNEQVGRSGDTLEATFPNPRGNRSRFRRLDQNEENVYKKLAELNNALEIRDTIPKDFEKQASNSKEKNNIDPDVQKLEAMMQSMQEDTGANKELDQLNGMLEKIMDIQHPKRLEEKLRTQSEQHQQQVFIVEKKKEDPITLLQPEYRERGANDSLIPMISKLANNNRFYGLDENEFQDARQSIRAIIAENQNLISGSMVKMLLTEEVFISGIKIPVSHSLYGVATLNGDRLQIAVTAIIHNDNILPVNLTVCDIDGQPGIFIPGALTRDVAKRSAAQATQQLSAINTIDPSLGAQVATAGIQMAQNLIAKNAKLVRVAIPSGYHVLLKDESLSRH